MITYSELYVGVDVSKMKHDIAILNAEKQQVYHPLVIEESHQGYVRLLAILHGLRKRYRTQRFHIGMEATGDYWKNLYYFLKEQGEAFEVVVINPVRTKAFAKTELRRAKTDPVNAKDIACFMVEKTPRGSTDRAPIFEAIKDIDVQLFALRKQQTMTLNKLRTELGKVAPELERAFHRLSGKQILALLAAYPTAEAIAQATVEELRQIQYSPRGWHLPVGFIHKVRQLAHNSVAHKRGTGAGVVVQSLIRRLQNGQEEMALLKKQIRALYGQIHDQPSILATIPGVSLENAAVLEAYIGDVHRFATAKQIVAYFGMNPVVNQSGKSKKRKSSLEKKGSGFVRHKLYMIILNIIKHKIAPFMTIICIWWRPVNPNLWPSARPCANFW